MDHIMIPSLPGRGTIWACTVGAAERLAEMNGCGAIRAEFGDASEGSDKGLLMLLESMGYSPAGVRALKRLKAKSGHDVGADDGDGVARSPRGLFDA